MAGSRENHLSWSELLRKKQEPRQKMAENGQHPEIPVLSVEHLGLMSINLKQGSLPRPQEGRLQGCSETNWNLQVTSFTPQAGCI